MVPRNLVAGHLVPEKAVIPVLGLILLWIVISPKRVEDIKLMGTVFLLGTVVDALLTLSGLFIFNETETLGQLLANSNLAKSFMGSLCRYGLSQFNCL